MLGYHDFLDGLTRGVAAHHAGMLPAFKQCVEELFVRGLCKVVFATETLALGINMPARTVVLEKLSKWNGETHADITPGEYTQLTGRAGRRGLDVEGHAVVLWQQGMNPGEVAGLASTRTYPLRSSLPPVVQHGRQPGPPGRPAPGPRAAGDVVRAVPGRQGRRRARPAAPQEPRTRCGGTPSPRPATAATSWSTPPCASALSELEKGAARARKADRREEVLALAGSASTAAT